MKLSVLLLPLVFTVVTFASITGQVYKELPVTGSVTNTYGVKETNERGFEGVTVTAYDANGNVAAQATTNEWGKYTLTQVWAIIVWSSVVGRTILRRDPIIVDRIPQYSLLVMGDGQPWSA